MEKEIILNKSKELCLRIIRMVGHLPESHVSEFIAEQVILASAHIGLNYKLACEAGTSAEALVKISLAEEKAHETLFWLEIIEGCELIKPDRLTGLKQETAELIAGLRSGLKTSKIGSRKKA
jgi:four helix bundle protein